MSSNRKRKHNNQRSSNRHYRSNPSRGGPGILLTCETSREIKCEREGREILRYYLDKESKRTDSSGESSVKLTLEQELAVLQQQKPKDTHGPFQLFDTGCAGTIFFMYADEANNNGTKDPTEGTKPEDTANKRIRTTTEEEEQAATRKKESKPCSFDPVKTVKSVMSDIASDSASSEAPASRFVTRMIPIQVTCFATLKELETVLSKLLESHKKTATSDAVEKSETFRIHVKKRQCHQVKSLDFIETAAGLVIKETGWKVQLTDPDHVIWIEVCKNLMGVSVFGRDDVNVAKNFNLAELRDKQHAQDGDDGNGSPLAP